MRALPLILMSVLIIACSSDKSGGGGSGNFELISSDYKLAAGSEQYQCQRVTIQKDLYMVQVTPDSPLGVHHEVLAIDPSGAYPDGLLIQQHGNPQDPACPGIGTNWTPLFASGVNSPTLAMPPNVALKISAGQQIVFNVHLVNATNSEVDGTATVHVMTAENSAGYQLAGVPFVGNVHFTIPPSGANVDGKCTISGDTTYFAVFPHMHLLGQHMKVWTTGSNAQTVWDADYSFQEQKFGTFSGIPLHAGDTIQNTCTFGPTGGGSVSFGESTSDEMCFAISYVTPMIDTTSGTFCTD